MAFYSKLVEHVIIASAFILVVCGYTRSKQSPDRIDDLVLPKVYSRHDPPLLDGVTDVFLGIYINSFYAISEQTMDYSVSLYLRQSWLDPRLKHSLTDNKTEKVKLEAAWDKMWVPDTFFRNEKKSGFHSVTVDNRMATVLPSGSVWYVIKISATLSCPMTLHKYPLDTQTCPMIFESFGYTVDTVQFKWMNSSVDIEDGMTLPQFTYEGHALKDCSQNYTSGTCPCLQIDFTLHRDLGYYFIQLFVPSILIVILSWVSFWINVDAAPARVSLGLLTVLTMANHSIGINANLPRVSYIKAIDVWMSSCLLFVFAALCEYAFVNVASRDRVIVKVPSRMDKKQNSECSKCIQTSSRRLDHEESAVGGMVSPMAPPPKPCKAVDADGKARARGIDKIARKSFPLAFILFNIVYWVGYTCEF